MTDHDFTSLDYVELKTLQRLVTQDAPLRCQGSYWTHQSDPKLAIALGTIQNLSHLGWIEPERESNGLLTKNWILTEKGKDAWHKGAQQEFDTRIEKQVERLVAASAAKKSSKDRPRGVYLADYNGIWIPRN